MCIFFPASSRKNPSTMIPISAVFYSLSSLSNSWISWIQTCHKDMKMNAILFFIYSFRLPSRSAAVQ